MTPLYRQGPKPFTPFPPAVASEFAILALWLTRAARSLEPWWLQPLLSLVSECSPAHQNPSPSQEMDLVPAALSRAQGHSSLFWQNLYSSDDFLSFLQPQKLPRLGTELETENNNALTTEVQPHRVLFTGAASKPSQRMSVAKADAPTLQMGPEAQVFWDYPETKSKWPYSSWRILASLPSLS